MPSKRAVIFGAGLAHAFFRPGRYIGPAEHLTPGVADQIDEQTISLD
jgi:hypothetical protein